MVKLRGDDDMGEEASFQNKIIWYLSLVLLAGYIICFILMVLVGLVASNLTLTGHFI